MHAGVGPPEDVRHVQEIQQWAETQRINALDLFSELGEQPPDIAPNLFKTGDANPDVSAAEIRETIGFPTQQQLHLSKSDLGSLPTLMREKFEALGILTLRHTDLKRFGIRGICLAEFPLPVIVFRDEAPTAQAFTLANELGHVLIKQSGITGPRHVEYEREPVERWCDKFAAAFLMPSDVVTNMMGPIRARPIHQVADEDLNRIAAAFRVSPHAMLIRLVHLGYVKAAYYWETKKPEFDASEREYRRCGRAKYYGVRYKSALGDLYTGLVLEAWATGKITNHNAAEFMGIKNINHLFAIRDNFRVP
jgi:Zn-dependent peptidase ImmA (M78 family)